MMKPVRRQVRDLVGAAGAFSVAFAVVRVFRPFSRPLIVFYAPDDGPYPAARPAPWTLDRPDALTERRAS